MRTFILSLFILLLAGSAGAGAAEIQVFSAGAVRQAQLILAPEFTQQTGMEVVFTFGSVGATVERLKQGAQADVIFVSEAGLDALREAGLLRPETITLIGSVSVGLGVRAGSPLPDISTVDKLRDVLLAANSITHNNPASGSTSGALVAGIIEQLGIADHLRDKVHFISGNSAEPVARGEVEINIQPVSEMLAVKGVILAGPLPAELGAVTTYGAAVGNQSSAPDKALAYIRYLQRNEAASTLRNKGLVPVGN